MCCPFQRGFDEKRGKRIGRKCLSVARFLTLLMSARSTGTNRREEGGLKLTKRSLFTFRALSRLWGEISLFGFRSFQCRGVWALRARAEFRQVSAWLLCFWFTIGRFVTGSSNCGMFCFSLASCFILGSTCALARPIKINLVTVNFVSMLFCRVLNHAKFLAPLLKNSIMLSSCHPLQNYRSGIVIIKADLHCHQLQVLPRSISTSRQVVIILQAPVILTMVFLRLRWPPTRQVSSCRMQIWKVRLLGRKLLILTEKWGLLSRFSR